MENHLQQRIISLTLQQILIVKFIKHSHQNEIIIMLCTGRMCSTKPDGNEGSGRGWMKKNNVYCMHFHGTITSNGSSCTCMYIVIVNFSYFHHLYGSFFTNLVCMILKTRVGSRAVQLRKITILWINVSE